MIHGVAPRARTRRPGMCCVCASRIEEWVRSMTNPHKYVYSFGGGTAEGKADMKALLGGKGANLAEMSVIGIPVPPGFTITTEVCAAYYENGKKLPEAVGPQVEAAIRA